MRLVIAECTVDYEGRLKAHLPRALRLLMVKADGCVAIHSDGGAYKPLNWMTAPKGERLVITIHEVISDTAVDLGDDPGLIKDGVEAHLQELLAARPWVLEDDLELIRREYQTDIGPVDLLCRSASGETVAVDLDPRIAPVRGMFVAQIIKPQAKTMAEARGLQCIEVDYDGLREIESHELKLF